MKRLTATLTVALAVPAVANAKPPTAAHRHTYGTLYHRVAMKFGRRAPGRNIIRDGIANGHPVTDAAVTSSIDVLQRMLAPAPAPPAPVPAAPVSNVTAPAPAATVTAAVTPVGAGAAVPACASESGTNYSTGPANTNPSSGATGRYQVLPSTHAALCSDLGWSPAEQDACAARIYAAQGSGAWVGCGG